MNSLVSRLQRVRSLLARAEAEMRRDAQDDDGKARSLANDLTWLRNRVDDRLRVEDAEKSGGAMASDPLQISIFDLLSHGGQP